MDANVRHIHQHSANKCRRLLMKLPLEVQQIISQTPDNHSKVVQTLFSGTRVLASYNGLRIHKFLENRLHRIQLRRIHIAMLDWRLISIGLKTLAAGSLLSISAMLSAQQPAVSGEDLILAAQKSVASINTDQLQRLIKEQPGVRIIDVRMPGEIAALGGTIDAGLRPLNINRGWLEFRITDSVPDLLTPVVVYCGINQRSPLAAETLMHMGYENVYNYADGFFAWRDAGLPVKLADEATGTMLYRKPVEVAPGVWSAIGATAPPSYENSGHNNNLSFIVTGSGVVVINAGDNFLLAQALHQEIKAVTDQPVKYVVLENGQGHAMLGSNYWQEQGAVVKHK